MVFQMYQTAFTDQNFLGQDQKCGKDSNLGYHLCLCLGCSPQKHLNMEIRVYTILQILSVTLFGKRAF